MKPTLRGRRAGTTLLETLMALTLLGVLITTTLNLMREQMRAFSSGTRQIDALQGLRYAMSVLEKDLATAGTNVGPDQPFLVYADTHVVVFNADYTSAVANDAFSVFVDTAASPLITTAVGRSRRFQIPRTSVFYPDTSYRMGGANSPAETLIFYFTPDSTTTRTDDYLLMRKVNDQPPEMISGGILRMTGVPFFQYFHRLTYASGPDSVKQVAAGSLPLRHTRPFHSVLNDTGSFAAIDRLRAIKVNFRMTDMQPGTKQRIFPAGRTIALANAGLAIKQTCGDEPILGTGLGFSAQLVYVGGVPAVQLRWNAAADETTGEQDVIRYVIYRREAPGPIGDPYLSIPSGSVNYEYIDFDIIPGTTYYYSIAAQDCTPSLSSIMSVLGVTIL